MLGLCFLELKGKLGSILTSATSVLELDGVYSRISSHACPLLTLVLEPDGV